MFDNVYLNSLVIILVVFLVIISTFFVYDLLIKKNKISKTWDIQMREYSLYIKYNFRTKKSVIENYQMIDQEAYDKLEEYVTTDDFHSSILDAKKSESGTFTYEVRHSNFDLHYTFIVKDVNTSSVVIKCEVIHQEKKDSIYLKTLDDLKMEHSMATSKHAGFFYINIKDFNSLNQRYGRVYGDYILEILRNRLNAVHKYKCSSAYVGGAQYAVYVNKKFSKRRAINFANHLVKALTKPIDDKYLMLDISVGIGVCIAEYEDLIISAIPTILVDKPKTLVGMGDTISSVSLLAGF